MKCLSIFCVVKEVQIVKFLYIYCWLLKIGLQVMAFIGKWRASRELYPELLNYEEQKAVFVPGALFRENTIIRYPITDFCSTFS